MKKWCLNRHDPIRHGDNKQETTIIRPYIGHPKVVSTISDYRAEAVVREPQIRALLFTLDI